MSSQVQSGRRTPQMGGGGNNKRKNKNKHGKQTPPVAVVPEEPVIEDKLIVQDVTPVVVVEPMIVLESITAANGNGEAVNGSDVAVEEKRRSRGNTRSPRARMTIDLTEDEVKEVAETVKAVEECINMTPEEPKQVVEETVVVEEPVVVSEPEPVAVTEEITPAAEEPVAQQTEIVENNEQIEQETEKNDEEMEALVVEEEVVVPPTPERAGGLFNFFRLTSNKKNKEDNLSTIVNLSTGSEPNSTEDVQLDYSRPIRGRRSTRAIKEIEFTYKKSVAVNLDDSSSSLNVTIGSEIHNDSLKTPATNRKRKDMTPESTTDIVMESPKRARLDLSGLFNVVASPVTMLKNRFSRVKLQSSTPNKNEAVLDDLSSCVTAEATTTTANISGDNELKMEVSQDESEVKETVAAETAAPVDASIAEEATESGLAVEQNQKLEEIDLKEEAKACDEEAVNVKEIATPAHRQWCNIM